MSKYGYDSVRKTVEELNSLPKPLSGMTLNSLREAEKRLKEARAEILDAIPVEDVDAFIEAWRIQKGFPLRLDGHNTLCENGQTLLANIQASSAVVPVVLPEANMSTDQVRERVMRIARKETF